MNNLNIKKILREYTHGHDLDTDLTIYDVPATYSKGNIGRDVREKIFDLEGSNRLLLQLIDDFNDLLINNPTEMTLLSKQLQNKLPETIQMLQRLRPEVRDRIMRRFIPKLKVDFFNLYSMTNSVYKKEANLESNNQVIPELEPDDDVPEEV